MKGKQQLLAGVLYRMHLLGALGRTASPRIVVFNYHRIRPDNPDFTTPFDDGVYGPTVSEFRAQIVWLKEHTTILSEADLIEQLRANRNPPKMATMITFDDGYRDNYDHAFPVLKQLGVPAMFFIPTAPITDRQLGWWDSIAYLIKKTNRPTIDSVPREQAIPHFLQRMKLEPHARTKNLLADLSAACAVALPDRAAQDAELMTWDQIREVSRHGITIGSHTHTHRVLATLSATEQREELTTSKAILERELGQPVNSLSYPVGNYQHFTADSRKLAAECRYALGFSFNTGINPAQPLEPYDVRRIEAPDTVAMTAARTVLPQVFVS